MHKKPRSIVEVFEDEFKAINSFWLTYKRNPHRAIREGFVPIVNAMQEEAARVDRAPVTPEHVYLELCEITDAMGRGEGCLGQNTLRSNPMEWLGADAIVGVVQSGMALYEAQLETV